MYKNLLFSHKSKIWIIISLALVMAMGFTSVAFTATPPPPNTHPDGKPAMQIIETLAEKLDMSSSDLRQALQDGKTIAELAQAQEVSLDDLTASLLDPRQKRLDQAVKDGKMTQEEADQALQDAKESLLNWMNSGELPNPLNRLAFRNKEMGIIADKLNMSQVDLRQALQDGKTISQLAETQKVTLDEISAAVIPPLNDRLNQAVSDGKLSQDQADQVLQKATENLVQWFETGERTTRFERGLNMVRSQLNEVAGLLGMSEDELKQTLQDGQTIAELAKAKDVSLDEITATMIAPLEERVSQAVIDGKMTQDQADNLINKAKERLLHRLENPGQRNLFNFFQHRRNHQPFGGNGSQSTLPSQNTQNNGSSTGNSLQNYSHVFEF